MAEIPVFEGAEKFWNFVYTIGVALGGLITFFGGRKLERRKMSKLDEAEKINSAAMHALISAASGIAPDKLTLEAIRTLLSSQKQSLETLEHLIKEIPAPFLFWMKERAGPRDYIMYALNDFFGRKYLGQPSGFYVGKRDHQVWPQKIAKIYGENDEKVFTGGTPVWVEEPADSPITGTRGFFEGVKFLLEIDGKYYVCGLGRHVEAEQDETKV